MCYLVWFIIHVNKLRIIKLHPSKLNALIASVGGNALQI